MKKEVVARTSRTVPAVPADDGEYAGMPVAMTERPEWLSLMAPETARVGTRIQGVYRYVIAPVRALAWAMMHVGQLILRGTEYWYVFALIALSAVTLLIIYTTR